MYFFIIVQIMASLWGMVVCAVFLTVPKAETQLVVTCETVHRVTSACCAHKELTQNEHAKRQDAM
jgi:hypothetical protein